MRATILSLVLAVSLSGTAAAQTLSTNNVRALSLEDCIQRALEKNLQIEFYRERVRFGRALLYSSYGVYDPELVIDAGYSSTIDESTTTTGTVVLPGERTQHALRTGIGGILPTGLRYDIGGDLFYNTRTSFSTNLSLPAFKDSNYRADTGIVLTQPLLRNSWIDGFRAEIRRNKLEVSSREHELLFRAMEIIRDVELNYYELIFAYENVRVQEKALELAQRQASENRKRVEVGTMAPLEEKQAESAAATARAALILALQELGTQQNLLLNLITDNYEEWQNVRLRPTENLVAVPQAYNLTASWVAALTQRPDFNQRQAQLEQAEVDVKLSHNQLFPQLDLVGSYGRQGVDRGFSGSLADIRDDTLPRYSVGIVFSLPFENRNARGLLRQSKSVRNEREILIKQLRQNILIQVEDAVGNAQGTFQRVAATREARLAAEAAFEAEVKKLENGKSTSFNVLSLQNDLTASRSEEIRALADYNRALSILSFSEGSTFQKHRISLKP